METTMPARLRMAAMILSLLACTACATTPRIELVKPPADLTACANEPVAPDLPARDWNAPVDVLKALQIQRDNLTLDYILELRSAWGDCSAKVAGVKAWSDLIAATSPTTTR